MSPESQSAPDLYSRRGTWPVIALSIFGVAFASSFGRFAFGVFLPVIIGPLLSNSKVLVGWAAAVGACGFTLGSLVFMRVTHNVLSLRTQLVLGLEISAAAAVVGATSTTAVQLYICLFLFGIGSAPVFIASSGLSLNAHRDRYRATALSIPMMGVGLGTALIPIIYIIFRHASGNEGWRVTWGLTAFLCTTLGLFAWRALLPIPPDVRQNVHGGQPGAPFILKGCYVCYGVAYSLMLTYFVIAIDRETHFSSLHIQIDQTIIGVFVILGVVVASVVDRVHDRLGPRTGRIFPLIVTCLLYAVAGPLALIGREPFFAISAACFGLGAAGNGTLIVTMVRDHVGRAPFMRVMATMTAIFAATQIFAPLIGAYTGGPTSYRSALVAVGVAGISGSVLGAFLLLPGLGGDQNWVNPEANL